jgi:AraC-like DNA-binding protein
MQCMAQQPIALSSISKEENLASQGIWWVDSTGQLPLENVWPLQAVAFGAWDALAQAAIPQGAAFWAAFLIKHEALDTAYRLWFPNMICDEFQAFHLEGGQAVAAAAGRLTPHQRLPFKENFMAIPMHFSGQSETLVLLRFRIAGRVWLNVQEVFLLTAEQEKAMRSIFHENRRSRDWYFLIFLTIVSVFIFLSMAQWSVYRDRAIPLYCLYLATVGLYYLRNLEGYQFSFRPLIKYISFAHYHLEILLAFLSYILYMKFANTMLELPRSYPAFSRLVAWASRFFLLAIPMMWMIGHHWGILSMEKAYIYIRMLFFLVALCIVIILWLKPRHQMAPFIASGTFFLVMGGVMTLLESTFGGVSHKIYLGGAFGWYVSLNEAVRIPIYDFKVGVLLEILAFFAALIYRQRLLNESYQIAKERLQLVLEKAPSQQSGEAKEDSYPFPAQSAFIKTAIACVEAHLHDENFKVKQFANAMGLGREALYQRIKRQTDLDPTAFLRTIRLWHARRLLRQGKLNVAEVAFAVGFKHPYYFSKVFKDEFGYLPSKAAKHQAD